MDFIAREDLLTLATNYSFEQFDKPANALIFASEIVSNAYSHYDNRLVDFVYSSFYHGVDWVYTYSESLFLYDFNVNYNLFSFNFYQDKFDYNYYSMWYNTLDVSYYNFFWSVVIDNFINLHLLKLDSFDAWFKSLLFSTEYSLILFNMPEFVIISNSFLKTFVLPFASHIDTLIFSMYDYENTTNPAILIPHFLINWLFIFYFFCLIVNYYTSSSKEESIVDHDFLITNTTVESEEEIGSIDDMFFGTIIIIFIFFWYFYANVYFVLGDMPETILAAYTFPFLFYMVLFIPIHLSWDFGLYFVCYLRGVGKAPISFVEIMYDYISFAAFYIRLIVQNVRLILMLFTFASFHELIFIHGMSKEWMMGNESFLDDLTSSLSSVGGFGYFLIFRLSGHILYFFYELFHLLFVITAQIIAFNAMTFWLFLFLYTMFSSEIHERFFTIKRILKKRLTKKYVDLKKKIFRKI